MVLVSHLSYKQAGVSQTEKEKMILKKDLWINDEGEVKEGSSEGLPKGWAKGKLVARAGSEISDLEAKNYGLKKETKAKEPKENK
jgi:hypothetical protein